MNRDSFLGVAIGLQVLPCSVIEQKTEIHSCLIERLSVKAQSIGQWCQLKTQLLAH